MTYNQQIYKYVTTFLEQIANQGQHSFKIFKGHVLISAFAILMVSIQCKGEAPPTEVGPGQFDPICPNGVASTEKVSKDDIEKCVSCNNYYALKRDETCAVVEVTTLAGGNKMGRDTSRCGSSSSSATCTNGIGPKAQFSQPFGVAVDKSGNVYVADRVNLRIRKITPTGVVTTLAGTGTEGVTDGAGPSSSDPSGEAKFKQLEDVAVDGSGNVYVADTKNHLIRKITPDGVVSTLAGTGSQGDMNGAGPSSSNPSGVAQFNSPRGIAVDGSGNVYVADSGSNRIRKIITDAMGKVKVSTLAGTGMTMNFRGGLIKGGDFMDGADDVAQFNSPRGIAVDGSGFVYVADTNNNRIRKITPDGVVSTLAGTDSQGDIDGAGNVAQFNEPRDVAVDGSGNVYVADLENHRIRKITPDGVVSTLAGGNDGEGPECAGIFSDDCKDGTGASAQFKEPTGVAVDDSGNVYVADSLNNRIRKITIPQ